MPDPQAPAGAATTKSPPGTGSVTDTRLLGAQLFNETWRLLEQEGRTGADDEGRDLVLADLETIPAQPG
jgi:hypothetical protein